MRIDDLRAGAARAREGRPERRAVQVQAWDRAVQAVEEARKAAREELENLREEEELE
jgi:hypothetical protein